MTYVRKYLIGTTVTVSENQRALVLRNGRFETILRPGKHWFMSLSDRIEVEVHNLTKPEFVSDYVKPLFADHKAVAEAHFTEVRTGPDEVAVVFRDDKLYGVQKPDGRSVFWTDAGPWALERIDVSETLEVPRKLADRLAALGSLDKIKRFNVEEGQKGLLYVDNAFERVLDAGTYAFWNVGRPVAVKLIDVRAQALEVTGQEVLTRDRVSIRVNLVARYKVTDPVAAIAGAKDFAEALYRALQHAFRVTLGAKTLDEILADKVAVDAEAAKAVRTEMAEIGVEVGEITVKDVILTGEMRDILNRVVEAEKQAEANVIRRREETSATRSLLNTAKVMAENPVMLRLKELEALEAISAKVNTLTIHNGTQGLLEDIVTLRGKSNA
jgi:regulator of protease activity HflC (stomatin/prohibitin superfamily)